MALVILIGICYIGFFSDFMSAKMYVNMLLVIFVIIDLGLYYLLNTWGIRRFEEL